MTTDDVKTAGESQDSPVPGEAWAFVGAAAYAVTNIFNRIAVDAASPLVAPVFRLFPLLAFSWTRVARRGNRGWDRLRPSSSTFVGWRVILVLLLGGTLAVAVGNVAFFMALQLGGVILAVSVRATSVLWSGLIARVALKEPLTVKMLLGILVVVIGVAMLSYGRATGGGPETRMLLAVTLSMVPAIAWAGSANCTRYALMEGVDKYLALAVSMTWGGVLLTAVLFVIGRGSLLWTTPLQAVGMVVLAGLLSGAAQAADAQALSLTTVATVSTIGQMNPVLSSILAIVLLGERPSLLMVIGGALTIAGVTFVQIVKPRPDDEDEQPPGSMEGELDPD